MGYVVYKLEQIIEVLRKVSSFAIVKLSMASFVATLSFFFDHVNADALVALFMLIVFDFATAIVAVRKDPGSVIESSRLWVTAVKFAIHFSLVSAGFMTERALAPLGIHLVNIIDEMIIGWLAAGELHSILENAVKMGYKVPKKIFDKISRIENKV